MTKQEIITEVRTAWGKTFPGEKVYFSALQGDDKTRIKIKYFRPEMKTRKIANFCKLMNCKEYSLKFKR